MIEYIVTGYPHKRTLLPCYLKGGFTNYFDAALYGLEHLMRMHENPSASVFMMHGNEQTGILYSVGNDFIFGTSVEIEVQS